MIDNGRYIQFNRQIDKQVAQIMQTCGKGKNGVQYQSWFAFGTHSKQDLRRSLRVEVSACVCSVSSMLKVS